MPNPEVTNGAYMMAKVFHDAYQQAELEVGRMPVAGWSSLNPEDRLTMALGFQKMLDLELIEPLGLDGFMKLRKAGWQSATSSRERAQRPNPDA